MHALDILFFMRPMLLLPVWTVYLLFYDFCFPDQIISLSVAGDLASLSLIAAGAYVINQIFDIETDRINRKLGFFDPPVSLTLRQGWVIYALLNLGALLYAAILRTGLFLPLSVMLAAGVLYSAPPIRAKDRPIPGLLFNGLSYSLFIFWSIAVGADRESIISGSLLDVNLPLVSSMFLAISAVYLMTTLTDAPGDRKTGKRTIGAVRGDRLSSSLAALMVAGSLALAYQVEFWPLSITAALSLPLFLLAAFRGGVRITLLSAKFPILALTALAAYQRPGYAVFCIALILLTRFYFKRRLGLSYPRLI